TAATAHRVAAGLVRLLPASVGRASGRTSLPRRLPEGARLARSRPRAKVPPPPPRSGHCSRTTSPGAPVGIGSGFLDSRATRSTGGFVKTFPTSKLRNVALVGHGGAGKTSLAEAMLFTAGAIPRLGRVEDHNTT